MEKQTNPSIAHKEYLLIAGLTLVAALMRFYELDRPLTGDEGRTFNRYGLLSWKILLSIYDDTAQHSLFSILSNFCIQLLGENEIAFRLPSFLAGVLAVPLIYYLSRALNNSRAVSFCSSGLLIFSASHLTYSQAGRGYSLTVFLAIALILAATKLLQQRNSVFWGGTLILSGFCLILTLPSNAFFLITAGVYCFNTIWLSNQVSQIWTDKIFKSISISFLLILVFAGLYFEGIQTSLLGFANSWKNQVATEPSFALAFGILEFLVSPWGPWFYIFVVLGCFSLRSKISIALFVSIFATPAFTMLITKIGGFPRTYIHTLPFLLILAALGIVEMIRQGKKLTPLIGKCLPTFIAIGLLYTSAKNLTLYFEQIHSAPSNASMAEAQQVDTYIREKVSLSTLIVLAKPDSDVTNHYLQKQIQDSALLFVMGKKPDRLIFITQHDKPPWSHPANGNHGNLIIPHNSAKQIASIGDTRIYEFDRNIGPLAPFSDDPDYETKLLHTYDSPHVKIKRDGDRKVIGKRSLSIINNTGKIFKLDATSIKHLDIKKEGAYILTIYLRAFTQQSSIFLLESNTNESQPARFAQLLPSNKNFRTAANNKDLMSDETGKLWEKAFFLYPLSKGRHSMVEVFNLIHQANYFDGVKSYILTK
jgi:hypothetical protein